MSNSCHTQVDVPGQAPFHRLIQGPNLHPSTLGVLSTETAHRFGGFVLIMVKIHRIKCTMGTVLRCTVREG